MCVLPWIQIALAVQQNGGAVNGSVLQAVREQLLRRWQAQYSDEDINRAVEVTISAMGPPQPPPASAAAASTTSAAAAAAAASAAAAPAPMPPGSAATGTAAATSLDPEAQVGQLFSWLHNYSGGGGVGDASCPPGLDEKVCHALQAVLAMAHNRALARRVHAQARSFASALPQGSADQQAAARAQVRSVCVTAKPQGRGYENVIYYLTPSTPSPQPSLSPPPPSCVCPFLFLVFTTRFFFFSRRCQYNSIKKATVEAVYNVIVGSAAASIYSTLPPLLAAGRGALLAALDKVCFLAHFFLV